MDLFPMFVKLSGRLAVVVGGGRLAETKIHSLLPTGSRVRVVAPRVTNAISEWVAAGKIEWLAKAFKPEDLAGAFLVIAATAAAGVNQELFREADARGILCNAVDDPERCHFYYPSVVRRGALQIAISTNGLSPSLAQRLRRELEAQFGPEYDAWLAWLGAMRRIVRARRDDPQEARELLHFLASKETFDWFRTQTQEKKFSRSSL